MYIAIWVKVHCVGVSVGATVAQVKGVVTLPRVFMCGASQGEMIAQQFGTVPISMVRLLSTLSSCRRQSAESSSVVSTAALSFSWYCCCRFGCRSQQTLDTYTAAVLAEAFLPKVEPRREWRALMDELAHSSCVAYRGVVKDATFLEYFRAATPEPELARLVRPRL